MGEMTPVFAMDHLRLREASQRTMRAEDAAAAEWPGSEAEPLEPGVELLLGVRGGKSFATQRSPCGEGVRR
jgi:hypothetical protein